MITLISLPRHAQLMGFWLAISLCGGLLTAVLSSLFIAPRWFGLGVALTPLLAVPGLLWPQAIARPYTVWNRLAHYFGRAARLWLMGICYYLIIILVAVGRAGSSLRVARPTPTASLWVPRGTLGPSAYVSQHGAATAASPQKGWIGTFLSWASESGNVWALSLLPFFILLAALQIDEKKSSFPAKIYTLF